MRIYTNDEHMVLTLRNVLDAMRLMRHGRMYGNAKVMILVNGKCGTIVNTKVMDENISKELELMVVCCSKFNSDATTLRDLTWVSRNCE